jgi:hypothetical protein
LEDPRVLMVGRRENLRWLAGEKDPGVSAMAIDEAADDEHGGK